MRPSGGPSCVAPSRTSATPSPSSPPPRCRCRLRKPGHSLIFHMPFSLVRRRRASRRRLRACSMTARYILCRKTIATWPLLKRWLFMSCSGMQQCAACSVMIMTAILTPGWSTSAAEKGKRHRKVRRLSYGTISRATLTNLWRSVGVIRWNTTSTRLSGRHRAGFSSCSCGSWSWRKGWKCGGGSRFRLNGRRRSSRFSFSYTS